MEKEIKKANLGSGGNYLTGYVNVDNNALEKADVVHDLNRYPYPFQNNEFDEILASHVIEHLGDPLDFLQELWRIAKPGAQITIKCPHFSCNWLHPRHKSAISINLFTFLDHNNSEKYLNADFQVNSVKMRWLLGRQGKRGRLSARFFNGIISGLANLNPALAERIWCYWVGGFEELIFLVTANKHSD
ncbi:TPA: hypothetical protein DCZ15_00910 [Candidatus Falkowbacteria bacterium]|nr:MAG: Methyltransferase domain protein [Candidatus Falkowbacteria bacterium GW2011_GWF2_43_32]HBA36415.1 hypothetical protein [Candidatus Falkowbacteria bacterium]